MTQQQRQNSDKTALSRSQALTECMFDGLEAEEVVNCMVDISVEVCAEMVYELLYLQRVWKFGRRYSNSHRPLSIPFDNSIVLS